MAPEMKDDLGRLKVVFGMRYVGQCSGDTKILLFVGNFGVARTGPLSWIKKREKMCLKAVVIDRVGRKAWLLGQYFCLIVLSKKNPGSGVPLGLYSEACQTARVTLSLAFPNWQVRGLDTLSLPAFTIWVSIV